MQTTTITYLPTPIPDVDYVTRGFEEDISATYLVAAYDNNALHFENKITLSGGGQVLQVMTKDESNLFTQAIPQNAFGINNEFVGIQMMSPVSGTNGFQYSVRIFKNSNTRNAIVPGTSSQIVLTDVANNPPQVTFAEVVNKSGSSISSELGFIGTMDVRPSMFARVHIRPGETVYVKKTSDGNLIFQF